MTINPDDELTVAYDLWLSVKTEVASIISLLKNNPRVANTLLRKAILSEAKVALILHRVPSGLSSAKEVFARKLLREIQTRLTLVPDKTIQAVRGGLIK